MDPFQAALAEATNTLSRDRILPALSRQQAAPQQLNRARDVDIEEHTREKAQQENLIKAAKLVAKERENSGQLGRRGRGGTRVIAVLLLIIDALPHEAVWRAWAAGCKDASDDADKVIVRFWVHAKYPNQVQSDWVRSKLLPHSHKPRWGSIQITMAMLDLLAAAVEDPEMGRIVYASESCIPLAPLQEVGTELWRADQSWINYSMKPLNGYDTVQKWDKMSLAIPKQCISKADQWTCLTREHAEDILKLPEEAGESLLQMMRSVTASDEMYIPTALCILGELLQGGKPGPRIAHRMITFCDWSVSAKNPTQFDSFEPTSPALAKAVAQGCLFGRKWSAESVPLAKWKEWEAARLALHNAKLDSMDETELSALYASLRNGQEPSADALSAYSAVNALQSSGSLATPRDGRGNHQQHPYNSSTNSLAPDGYHDQYDGSYADSAHYSHHDDRDQQRYGRGDSRNRSARQGPRYRHEPYARDGGYAADDRRQNGRRNGNSNSYSGRPRGDSYASNGGGGRRDTRDNSNEGSSYSQGPAAMDTELSSRRR